ncbi:MAG: cell division protein FtsA [Patescibacteria group bacterium]
MVKEEIINAIDIGSSKVRTLVAKVIPDDPKPHIIGVGEAEASGVRRGAIADIEETVTSISNSLEQAERVSGVPVQHAYISVGGGHIISEASRGVIAVARADNEITEDDVGRAIEAASTISLPQNHEILHIIPRNFTVDNQSGIKNPAGMTGVRLEVEAIILEAPSSYVKNLVRCVNRVNVEVDDLVVAPLAAAQAALSKRQKELGVVLINIGSGTTGVVIYEEGDLLHSFILPVGSEHITNDLAIGLRTSVDVAEKVKLEYGSATPSRFNRKDEINLQNLDEKEEGVVSSRQIAEVIEARLVEIFSLINKELKKIDRAGKLPAGAVLVGGGAKLPGIVELAKNELKLPVRLGALREAEAVIEEVNDPSYATAMGLIFWGMGHLEEQKSSGFNIGGVSDTVGKIRKFFKNFLP